MTAKPTNNFGLTPELLELIKKEEGWVDHPYLCPAGYPTIGWGHRIPSMNHPKITAAEGLILLQQDLTLYRDMALRMSPVLQHEPERRLAAITDFCFNAGGAAYSKSVLRTMVNKKDWKAAGAQMRRWVYATHPKGHPKAGQKFKLAGLISRREKTAKWLEAE